MFRCQLRCDGIRLASFAVIHDSVAVHFHVDREELDNDIVTGHKIDELGCLGLVQLAAFYLGPSMRPTGEQTRQRIKEFGLDRGWNYYGQNKREERLPNRLRPSMATDVKKDAARAANTAKLPRRRCGC